MKILLAACNAKYIHSNLAVYDLKAYSSDYDEHVILREYTINQPKDEILKDIYSSGADVVCFSCYIWNIAFVKEYTHSPSYVSKFNSATQSKCSLSSLLTKAYKQYVLSL